MVCLRVVGYVEGDDVAPPQELLKASPLHAQLLLDVLLPRPRVVDEVHPEGLQSTGGGRAYLAEADQADGLPHDLDAPQVPVLAGPLPRPDCLVGAHDPPSHGEHQGHGHLRDRLGEGRRRVEDDLPQLPRGLEVHVVAADPVDPHGLEPWRGGHDLPCHLDAPPGYESVSPGGHLPQRVDVRARGKRDDIYSFFLQEFYPGLVDGLGDNYSELLQSGTRKRIPFSG